MGVGSEMSILEIAVLVVAFKDIPENTEEPEGRSTGVSFAVAERPFRRALKHEAQYTGLEGSGRNGTVVDVPHSAQTAGWRCVRFVRLGVDGLGRVNRDSIGTQNSFVSGHF
jgi:hypothetical protein